MADDRRLAYQGSPSGYRGQRRKSGYECYKRGLNTKIHLAVDAHGMPVRMLITEGTRADRAQAAALIVGIGAENLMADRAYDTDEIISEAKKAGMEAVMPPKRKRKEPRLYDEYLYKLRHLVENAFLHLKSWRGIATRHAKNATSFLAAARIRCIALWAGIL
ncbi:MAG: IS5 family transposase [Synergistaceae bacterium]|nr:IS5 family transposase [Synergistaceae bacterium]